MTLEGWSEFNLAVAGAAAALAGLLIVALSVNVEQIVKAPTLTARAASAISTLLLAVVASLVALIPAQNAAAIAIEIGIGLVVASGMQIHAMVTISRDGGAVGVRVGKSLPGLVPLIAFALGCTMLALGMPGAYYAVAAGCILAIVNAVIFSWVALVEVLR